MADLVSLEYIAGFVDGEGCLTIGKRYNVAVTIGQVDRRPLDAIARRYGGHFHYTPARGAWRAAWTLTISGNAAVRLLRDTLEFLIVKREQAELVLDVMALKRQDFRRPPLTIWERAERESYRLALLDLRAA